MTATQHRRRAHRWVMGLAICLISCLALALLQADRFATGKASAEPAGMTVDFVNDDPQTALRKLEAALGRPIVASVPDPDVRITGRFTERATKEVLDSVGGQLGVAWHDEGGCLVGSAPPSAGADPATRRAHAMHFLEFWNKLTQEQRLALADGILPVNELTEETRKKLALVLTGVGGPRALHTAGEDCVVMAETQVQADLRVFFEGRDLSRRGERDLLGPYFQIWDDRALQLNSAAGTWSRGDPTGWFSPPILGW